MSAATEAEVIEREVAPTLPSSVGAAVDIQVATAKRFPRSVESFMRRATEMATLTPEIAAACVYALPRDGKMIEGPSARLAEIVAHAWGNLRVQGGAEGDSETDSPFIVGYGEAWDVEVNTAVRFEVRRRITGRNGKRFGDDMVVVTGNAAASIALRNAVFKAVPSPFWRPIYTKCRQVIAGEAQTFAVRRDEMIKKFNVIGVTNEQLYGVLGVKGLADVTLDHMVQITGAYNALKEGEITVEEFIASGATPITVPQPAQRKSQQQPTVDPLETPQQGRARTAESDRDAKPAVSSTDTDTPALAPKNVGVITAVTEKGAAVIVTLNTGYRCSTRADDLMQAVVRHRDEKTLVELVCRPSSDPTKFAPVLEECIVVKDEATS